MNQTIPKTSLTPHQIADRERLKNMLYPTKEDRAELEELNRLFDNWDGTVKND